MLALDLWDGNAQLCELFRSQTGITYPILMLAGTAGVGTAYDCIQTSFFVIDGEGVIRYRRTNAEHGMPTFLPDEVGPVVDQAIADLQISAIADLPGRYPFELEAAYPNPFNPTTTIPYQLLLGPGTAMVELKILDMRGMLVQTLVSAQQETGQGYEVIWDGRNQAGRFMPSGVYIASLSVDGETRGRLIVLVE